MADGGGGEAVNIGMHAALARQDGAAHKHPKIMFPGNPVLRFACKSRHRMAAVLFPFNPTPANGVLPCTSFDFVQACADTRSPQFDLSLRDRHAALCPCLRRDSLENHLRDTLRSIQTPKAFGEWPEPQPHARQSYCPLWFCVSI